MQQLNCIWKDPAVFTTSGENYLHLWKKMLVTLELALVLFFFWEAKTLCSTSAEQVLQGKPTELRACDSSPDYSFISLAWMILPYYSATISLLVFSARRTSNMTSLGNILLLASHCHSLAPHGILSTASKYSNHTVFHKWVPATNLVAMFSLNFFFLSFLLLVWHNTAAKSLSTHYYWTCRVCTMKHGNDSRWSTSNIHDKEHHYPWRTPQNRGLRTVLRGYCAYHWLARKTQPVFPQITIFFYLHYTLQHILQNSLVLLGSGFHQLRCPESMLNILDVGHLTFLLHSVCSEVKQTP